jgi:hypothetical protein
MQTREAKDPQVARSRSCICGPCKPGGAQLTGWVQEIANAPIFAEKGGLTIQPDDCPVSQCLRLHSQLPRIG